MLPSARKPTSPCSGRRSRRATWSSTAHTCLSSAPVSRAPSAALTVSGSRAATRSAAATPRMRRPAAGSPAVTRINSPPAGSTRTAVRSSTSCPSGAISSSPLFPLPRREVRVRRRASSIERCTKSADARRASPVAHAKRGSEATPGGSSSDTRLGAANGSPWTWSNESTSPDSSKLRPRRSL